MPTVRDTYGARRYNQPVILTLAKIRPDEFGHAAISKPEDVLQVYAYVRQMSAQKTLATFQQVDVIGLEIEFRKPSVQFNGLRYDGHEVQFAQPEDDGRILRISGYYQQDSPNPSDAYPDNDYGADYY